MLLNGRFLSMYSLFVKWKCLLWVIHRVMERGGFADLSDDDWTRIVLSLGYESCSSEMIRVLRGDYEVELLPFEK